MNLGHITGEDVYSVDFKELERAKGEIDKMNKYRVLILRNGNGSLVNTSNIKSLYRDYGINVTFIEDSYESADYYLDKGSVDMVVVDISGKTKNHNIGKLVNNIGGKPVVFGIIDEQENIKKAIDYGISAENIIQKPGTTEKVNYAIYTTLKKMFEQEAEK